MHTKETRILTTLRVLEAMLNMNDTVFRYLPGFVFMNDISDDGENIGVYNLFANDTALNTLGYTRPEICKLGKGFFREILDDESYSTFQQSVEYLLRKENDEKSFGSPFRMKKKNGDFVWVIGYCKLLKNYFKAPAILTLHNLMPIGEEMLGDVQVARLLRENRQIVHKSEFKKISQAEIKVLKLIKTGLSAKKIAEKLFISEDTVNTHKKKMMKKLCLPNAAALAAFANDYGLE